jgi:hypothetical protein
MYYNNLKETKTAIEKFILTDFHKLFFFNLLKCSLSQF